MTGESRKCYNNSRRRYQRIPPVYGAGWNSIEKTFKIKYNDSSIDQVGEETLIIVRSVTVNEKKGANPMKNGGANWR